MICRLLGGKSIHQLLQLFLPFLASLRPSLLGANSARARFMRCCNRVLTPTHHRLRAGRRQGAPHRRRRRGRNPGSERASVEPEDNFRALPPVTPLPTGPYSDMIRAAAQKSGVDEKLITHVIKAEVDRTSNPRAVSRKTSPRPDAIDAANRRPLFACATFSTPRRILTSAPAT